MTFSPDLIARVRHALARVGYCFLTADEIQRLLASAPRDLAGRRALQEFARICGAEVETTTHLKSARFTPVAGDYQDTPETLCPA